MWWSPDSRKLAYYRFDERDVHDYYVALQPDARPGRRSTPKRYPTAGLAESGRRSLHLRRRDQAVVRVDVRDGKPFDDAVVGHYVYGVSWSADGSELLFLRTNRRQNVMEVAAADPATGTCRVVLREEWPTGWVMSEPRMLFLADGKRFIWESQRNGWNNFYLYDLCGRLIAPLTASTTFEAATLVKLDEQAGVLFYTARDGDNPLKLQLHRVGLDGTDDRRLTDPAFHHTVGGCIPGLGSRPEQPAIQGTLRHLAGQQYFVDVYQTHDTPPATRLPTTQPARRSRSSRERHDKVRRAGSEEGGAVHVHGRRRHDATLRRAAAVSDGVRSRRSAIPCSSTVYGGPEFAQLTARETFVAPSPAGRVRLPGRQPRFARACRARQARARRDLSEARAGRDRRPGRGRARRSGIARTSTRRASASSAPLTAATRRSWNCCAIPTSSPPRRPRLRRPTGATTTRSTPSATCAIPQENTAGYDAGSAMTYAQGSQGPAPDLLRHRRQQRPPVELAAADQGPAGRRQELRRPGRPRPGPQRPESGSHDGVLHRGAASRALTRRDTKKGSGQVTAALLVLLSAFYQVPRPRLAPFFEST